MIDDARTNLASMGLADKFELICADIFDETFALPEKVDMVICSYTLSTFINKEEMLTKILSQCRKQIKPSGMVFLTEFSYVNQPCDDWFYGMYTLTATGLPPKHFEPFLFHIVTAPENSFEIFNIPSDVMYKAGLDAGFTKVDYKLQYPSKEYENHPVVRKYFDECNGPDYLMKLRF